MMNTGYFMDMSIEKEEIVKDAEYYRNLPYRTEIIKDAEMNSFVAYCLELEGCITAAYTAIEAIESLEDAKRTWLSSALEHGDLIPEPDYTLNFSGQIRLRVPKSLHRRIFMEAKEEGVSMNQYCIMKLASAVRAKDSIHE